jgi:cellulose synthase/poly-beta-1,6-N-acetylglucosamine synthase-like glycosyltransferase
VSARDPDGVAIVAFWIIILIAALGMMWIVQLVPVLLYVRQLRRNDAPAPGLNQWPKIRVFVPLRGGDESQLRSLTRLLAQDYSNFEVQIVIDGQQDPAWRIVSDFLRQHPHDNVQLVPLRIKLATCSLLCSALVQFVEDLDESVELIAFCGADMRVPRGFLRELATAMNEPGVGGTLGGRWYAPRRGRWGSLARYVWNAGAIVPMWCAGIPWGGALTLRPRDIRASGLLDRWRHGMVEDAPVKSALASLGLKLKFVPSLLVINEEETNLTTCLRFVTRQLIWTRLYHPQWWLVVCNAALFTVTMLGPMVAAGWCAIAGHWTEASICLAAGVTYIGVSLALLLWIEHGAAGILRRHGESGIRLTPRILMSLFLVIPLTQLLYAVALLRCLVVRQVHWAGVDYDIRGPWNIHVVAPRESAGAL